MVSLVFCVVITCFFVAGNALKCYQCFADDGETCDNQIVECPSTLPGYCGSLVATYDGKRYFHRGCLRVNNCITAADDFRKFLRILKSDFFLIDCSSCSTDYCNSTENIHRHTHSILLCSLLAIYHLVV